MKTPLTPLSDRTGGHGGLLHSLLSNFRANLRYNSRTRARADLCPDPLKIPVYPGLPGFRGFLLFACLGTSLLLLGSCKEFFGQGRTGTLAVNLPQLSPPSTRAGTDFPDAGTFRITVAGASGQVIYENDYAHFPEELPVPAGSYTVSATSRDFSAPEFDAPQWGDTQVVSVAEGSNVAVNLSCSQLNSGLRLTVEDSFREAYPHGKLTLKGAGGTLPYGYDETRVAFLLPGSVTLALEEGGTAQTLFTRRLEACQILSVRLGASSGTRAGSVSVRVDTTRDWRSEQFVAGGGDAHELDGAYDVLTARDRAGERGVWVQGYIVGVATNTRKVAFAPPFNKNTNLVLGTRASTTGLEHCLSVELPAGELRDALNLQDHPELLGRGIYVRGDLVAAYYGIPGLKAPSEYQFR